MKTVEVGDGGRGEVVRVEDGLQADRGEEQCEDVQRAVKQLHVQLTLAGEDAVGEQGCNARHASLNIGGGGPRGGGGEEGRDKKKYNIKNDT